MKLTKFADLSKEARENAILIHSVRTDLYEVWRFIDGVAKSMSYGHDTPVSPERLIVFVGRLIDVINEELYDYDCVEPMSKNDSLADND